MSLIDSIISAESGGNPNARNPNSSAAGLSQFIDSTWLSMLAKHRPDITGSREELLAKKFDPTLSREMTGAYASDNAAILTKGGHEVTPGNSYLAHFAGPGGAVSVLNADPNAPVGSVLGQSVVDANPFLQKMTVTDLRAWADRKVGGAPSPIASRIMGTQQPATPPPSLASRIMGTEQPSAPQPAPAPQAAPQQPYTPQEQPSLLSQMEFAPPVFAPAALPIDIASLLKASGNRGSFYKG